MTAPEPPPGLLGREWESFRGLMPDDSDPAVVEALRKAFYCGGVAALHVLDTHAWPQDLEPVKRGRTWTGLLQELHGFLTWVGRRL